MPETHWKQDAFWTAVIGTAIASFIVWFSAGYRIGLAVPADEHKPYQMELIIKWEDVQQQAIYPVRQRKRSEPGVLSPEMEHWQAINMIFRDERSLEMLRGPK